MTALGSHGSASDESQRHPRSPRRATDPNPDRELIAGLAGRIDTVLRPLIPTDRPVALVDFPNYSNIGDSAIWLGTRAYLAGRGIPVAYTCDRRTYSDNYLKRRVGNGTILIQGGGNFGDLYPHHEAFRRHLIETFPGNRIIQLPQTVHYAAEGSAAPLRAAIGAHHDVHILVRDQTSRAVAQRLLNVEAPLSPDMAFCMGPLQRDLEPEVRVAWLARADQERPAGAPPLPQVPGTRYFDWCDETTTWLTWLNARLSGVVKYVGGPWGIRRLVAATCDPLARERVKRGSRLLGQGTVVVTDRLHGHILSILLGIQHFVLDNSYGKNRAFWQAWTAPSTLAHWAASSDEAIQLAARAG